LDHFGLERKGLDEFRVERFRNYKSVSQTISRLMSEQQKETFAKVLTDVENFVR
jgi:hypothetical protein